MSRPLLLATFLVAPLLLSPGSGHAGSAWPQFRGRNCGGVAEDDRPPIEFGPQTNLLWKVHLAAGLSSPVLWGERLFLTACESNRLETLCIRRRDGRTLWVRAAPAAKLEVTHPASNPANATPATDGKRVYVYFGSYGVLAYGMDGREAWRRPLPAPSSLNGSGTSPSLMEDHLIINRDQEDQRSSLLALAPATGRTLWETPRPGFFSSYTTAILWKHHGHSEAVMAGSFRVVGYDLKTGRQRWSVRGLEAFSVCATPVVGEGMLYATSYSFGHAKLPSFAELASQLDKDGDHRISRQEAQGFLGGGFDSIDRNKDGFVTEDEWNANLALLNQGDPGVFAVRSPGAGDVAATHVVWRQTRGASTVPSPLFYRGRIYLAQDGGRVTCYEASSGNPVYQQERLDAEGEYYASPIAANGCIYFCSTRGTVTVVASVAPLKVLARNQLGERIVATPAIAADTIYVRTTDHLWAFGAQAGGARRNTNLSGE